MFCYLFRDKYTTPPSASPKVFLSISLFWCTLLSLSNVVQDKAADHHHHHHLGRGHLQFQPHLHQSIFHLIN